MNATKAQKLAPPRIFISHTWEEKDKALAERLERELTGAGVDNWVDHSHIHGGDDLPVRISKALEWCNTMLLVWSKDAKNSYWVQKEWSNAVTLQKLIIPCRIDETPMPAILASTFYVDFSNRERGLRELLRALDEADEKLSPNTQLASVIHRELSQSTPSPTPKPPQDEPPPLIALRHTPVASLAEDAVKKMLRDKIFFDYHWNASGKHLTRQYESFELQKEKFVFDHGTQLTWQQGGTKNYINFSGAGDYIRQLNLRNHGGYKDWRLPTLEEGMSLMEHERKNDDLHLAPVFDRLQWRIWTADLESAADAWVVVFFHGHCGHYDLSEFHYVRAVRS